MTYSYLSYMLFRTYWTMCVIMVDQRTPVLTVGGFSWKLWIRLQSLIDQGLPLAATLSTLSHSKLKIRRVFLTESASSNWPTWEKITTLVIEAAPVPSP